VNGNELRPLFARRRARATACWAVVTLAGLNLLLAGYVEWRPGFRDPLFDMKARALSSRFDEPAVAVRIVAFGSSRTAASIEPGTLEATLLTETGQSAAAYNMALQGDGPIGELIHFRRLLARRKAPDVAIIELLPYSFAWYGDRPYDATVLRADRLTKEELATVCEYGFPAGEVNEHWREATFNPWFGNRFQLLAHIDRNWLPPGVVTYHPQAGKHGGWDPWGPLTPAAYAQAAIWVRKTYEPELPAIKFTGPHVKAFDDLLLECQNAGITVAVVVPPEGSVFRSWYPPRVNVELAAFLERLRREYKIMVVDARTWLPDEAFVDTHHVLGDWAKPYTQRLTREVIVPAMRAQVGLSTARGR
jgi:hypothetical protein